MEVDPHDLDSEKSAFDNQAKERIKNGLIPDFRRLEKVPWFYNNTWREPEFVKIHMLPRVNWMIETAKSILPNRGKILELGCGTGQLALEFARNGFDMTGVDLSPESIRIAEKYNKENPFKEGFGSLSYRCGDMMKMDFKDAAFDAVIFFRSLHHIPYPTPLLKKLAEFLKPGAGVIISEPVRGHFTKDSAFVATLLRLLLPTWIPTQDKLNRNWDEKVLEEEVNKIYTEYTYDDDHQQSVMDNSTDTVDAIKSALNDCFEIKTLNLTDAFVDKIIGGLRGENQFTTARFLKFLDDYMVQKKMLPGTSVDILAVRR